MCISDIEFLGYLVATITVSAFIIISAITVWRQSKIIYQLLELLCQEQSSQSLVPEEVKHDD